jgi:hypothetical protein
MIRRPIALLFAAALAALAFAGAGSAAATLPFNVSTTVEAGTLATGCCADSTTGLPTSVVVPGLGRATLTAEFFVCGVVGCFPDGFSSLSLQFVTPSGDTLLVVGSGTGTLATPEHGAGTWSVSSASTGRFAGATGAGTYTASVIVTGTSTGGPAPSELTFSLVGTITRR